MSNVLSQEEVDSLLRGLTTGEIETETTVVAKTEDVVLYDFTHQEKMLRGKLPAYGSINDRFATSFRSNLSAMVRRSVDIESDPPELVKFETFRRSLPVPTSLHVFRVDPLRGQALLVFDSRLVFSLIDCYFGGKGAAHVKIEGRDFTAIENATIHKVVMLTLQALQKTWERVIKVSMIHVRSEMNPEFAGIVLPADMVVVSRFNVDMEGAGGHMSTCIPYSILEPVRDCFYSGPESGGRTLDAEWKRRVVRNVRRAPVNVVFELGTATITAEYLLSLKVGDVLQLEQDIDGLLTGRVSGVRKFEGRPGMVKSNRAVRIEKRRERALDA